MQEKVQEKGSVPFTLSARKGVKGTDPFSWTPFPDPFSSWSVPEEQSVRMA